jgi:hypothetical protein
VIICLIALASFVLFAVNQTSNASAHQQRALNNDESPSEPSPTADNAATGATATAANGSGKPSAAHHSALRRAIDDASNALTSPFAGLVKSSDSEWAKRGARVLLALAVYGFGLGYLARLMRVRV